MVVIPGKAYCIDATEVTKAQYLEFMTESGIVPSGQGSECAWNTSLKQPPAYDYLWNGTKDDQPARPVDWCDAVAYCKWAGKRLCGKIGGGTLAAAENKSVSSQYFFACSKGGLNDYPYGPTYQPKTCNDDNQGATPAENQWKIAAVGANPGCQGGYPGVFDLSGNSMEWVDSCEAEAASPNETKCHAQGGTWIFPGNSVFCGFTQTAARNTISPYQAIRCCKDL